MDHPDDRGRGNREVATGEIMQPNTLMSITPTGERQYISYVDLMEKEPELPEEALTLTLILILILILILTPTTTLTSTLTLKAPELLEEMEVVQHFIATKYIPFIRYEYKGFSQS